MLKRVSSYKKIKSRSGKSPYNYTTELQFVFLSTTHPHLTSLHPPTRGYYTRILVFSHLKWCRPKKDLKCWEWSITSHQSSWQYGAQWCPPHRSLKKRLAGKRFASDTNVKQAVSSCQQTLDTDFFRASIQALV